MIRVAIELFRDGYGKNISCDKFGGMELHV